MRVVSWNIELGRNIEQAVFEFRSFESLGQADIVLLQEMDEAGTRRIADLLDMDHRYSAPAIHPATGLPFGNAVLSPWPMGEAVALPLPHTAKFQGQERAATLATVEVDGIAIVAYSVHIETVLLELRHRVMQVTTIAEDAQRQQVPHVVIGGDFNTASRRSRRTFDRAFGQAGFARFSNDEAHTFERFRRPFMLDHVYGRGLRLGSAGVAAGPRASDHQPIWVDLSADRTVSS